MVGLASGSVQLEAQGEMTEAQREEKVHWIIVVSSLSGAVEGSEEKASLYSNWRTPRE